MKRAIGLFITFGLFACTNAFSQNLGWNEYNKYWYYRYRLVNNFLVRGEENPLVCDQPSG